MKSIRAGVSSLKGSIEVLWTQSFQIDVIKIIKNGLKKRVPHEKDRGRRLIR